MRLCRRLFPFSVFFLSCLAACSTITTVGDIDNADPSLPRGRYYLPRTIFNVKATVDPTTHSPSLSVTKSVEADPRIPLSYRFDLSSIADDTLEVDTDESGLITSLSSDTTDESGNIVLKIADIVFTSLTGGATAPNDRALPTDALTSAYSFGASYDPLDAIQSAAVNWGLARANFCILVNEEAQVTNPANECSSLPTRKSSGVQAVSTYVSNLSGIYYRKAVATPVKILRRSDTKSPWETIFVGNEQIFDQSVLYNIQINRTAFVDKKYNITFTNGSLQKVTVSKPSEVLAGLQIPLTIAKIVFAIPLSGLQQNTNLINAQTSLANAQASYINAEKSLIPLAASAQQSGISVPGLNRSLEIGPTIVTPGAINDCLSHYPSLTLDQCRALLQK